MTPAPRPETWVTPTNTGPWAPAPVAIENIDAPSVPRIPVFGLVAGDASAAAKNTELINAALSNPEYKRVHIPEGEYYVTSLVVPANKELTGEYSRAYSTPPTTGTRLRCGVAAQTAAVVTLVGRSKLTNIAILGAGNGAQHAAVLAQSNGGVLRDCATGAARYGIDGNYKLLIVDNVHVFGNSEDGIRNILDGKVISCTINSNSGRGISAGAGANCTQYINNRIEWNNSYGVELFQATKITLVGNIIDRNGRSGVRAVGTTNLVLNANTLWRNGRLSSGTPADDNNVYLQTNTRYILVGNVTQSGEDDGGGGYNSPINSVRAQANTDGLVTSNDLTGGTAVSWSQVTGSPEVATLRYGNKLRAGEGENYIGPSYLATAQALGVTAGSTANMVLTLPALETNSLGRLVTLDITARDHASSTPLAAQVPVYLGRPLTSAPTATLGTLTNVAGTAFSTTTGTHVVSVSISADGTSLTVSVTNGAAGNRSFLVRSR